MNNAAVRACDRIIVWGVPLLGFIIPLAVFPSYTFLFIKSTILQCGAAVLFAAWAVKAIEVRSFGVDKKLNVSYHSSVPSPRRHKLASLSPGVW